VTAFPDPPFRDFACDINRLVNGLQGLLEDIVQLFAIGIPSDASKSPVSSPTQPFVVYEVHLMDKMRPHIRTIFDEIILFEEYISRFRPLLFDQLL
jgi:hypothetical protein